MNFKIKIDGIYDDRTIKALGDLVVNDIGLDFRPLSFNFLQQYRFLDMVKDYFRPNNRYFLHYANEQDYIIWKMINDLKELRKGNLDNFVLEFSDIQAGSFYDQFSLPYFWRYSPDVNPKTVYDDYKNLKGIVLPFSFLESVQKEGNFYNFVQNFTKVFYKLIEERNIELSLLLDWDSNIFPTLFDYFDFDIVTFAINNKIEICYRNVDLQKVQSQVNHCRSLVF